jgi:hypothetical protein
VPDPPAAAAGPLHAEEAEREDGGQLDRRGGHDEQGARQEPAVQQVLAGAQPDLEPGEHQADHQGLVVDAADEVEQHERVGRPQPEREAGVEPAPAGEQRQRPHDQPEAGEREQAVLEDAEHHVVARQRGDHAPHQQEQRAVGGGGVPPDRGDAAGERVVHPQRLRRPEHVRVEPAGEDRALREVAVDVAGEQRGRHRERHRPQHGRAGQLRPGGRRRHGAAGPQHLADPQPGEHEHADAGVGDGDGDGGVAAGQPEQPQPEHGVGHREGTGAEPADGHQQGAREPEAPGDPARVADGGRTGCRARRGGVELPGDHGGQRIHCLAP